MTITEMAIYGITLGSITVVFSIVVTNFIMDLFGKRRARR